MIDRFDDLNITLSHPDVMRTNVVDSSLVVSMDCATFQQVMIRIPFQGSVRDHKLRISLTDSAYISYIGKVETFENGVPVPKSFEHTYLDYHKGPVFFSLDNKRYDNLTFYFHCTFQNPDITATVRIDKIEIVPVDFRDDRDFAYVLALLVLLLFLAPGFLAYCALFGQAQKEHLLALVTPLSIVCFIVLYPVILLHQAWSTGTAGPLLLGGFAALNLFFIILIVGRGRTRRLVENFRLVRFELLAVVVVILGVAALLTKGLDLPLHTFNHTHLRNLTYDVFYAHDSVFQYVNGLAIYHNEPFSKYYVDGKLIYDVQDRGIIGGVIYAVVRGIASPFGADIAYSQGFYNLFGSALNVLVLLPVFALHAYLFKGKARPILILVLVSASAFMVTNYIITWYKLAAAGLVISGIVLLLLDRKNIRQWAICGIVWGLAANFHPSVSLTYPIVSIWLLYRFARAHGARIVPVSAALFVLLAAFTAMLLPWTIVKGSYYQDTNTLFRQHFLGFQRYDTERGIVGSIDNFLGKYTLEQQVSRRLDRLAGSLRLEEMESLLKPDPDDTWEDRLLAWNAMETSYAVFVLTPFILLLLISSLLSRALPGTAWSTSLTRHRSDALWLSVTQALTILLVIFGSFGPFEPDINWHIPMSCMVIVLYLLVHGSLATGRIGAALVFAYAAFAHYRLFFEYF